MINNCVAILDIRSYDISFMIGKNGYNGTFVFLGNKSVQYEGFTTEGFLDENSFMETVRDCVESVMQSYKGKLKEIYVSLPSAFMTLSTKGQTISFAGRKTISKEAIESLYEAGLTDETQNGRLVDKSSMYMTFADNRRRFNIADLIGEKTSVLKGALCYYYANEDFCKLVEEALLPYKFKKIKYVPQDLAQALYLLPSKIREGYAFILDVGYLTSTISVIYGGGIVSQTTFDSGVGTVLIGLADKLNVEFEKAEEILMNTAVTSGMTSKTLSWVDGDGNSYSVNTINETIKCGLDDICESADLFLSDFLKNKDLSSFITNPLYITGEGLENVKGGAEHIASRIGRLSVEVCPDIPYYDKPSYSSRISLLAKALKDNENKNFLWKVFHSFGGNN